MARPRWLAAALGVGVAVVAVARHLRATQAGTPAAGGVLITSPGAYERLMGLAFGSFYDRVAADVAASLPAGARILEVGCGPGHLARRLASRGFEVTGLDLDPAMIERARAAASATAAPGSAALEYAAPGALRFVVGDVAALPFEADRFDGVISTLSMHHWDDPSAGLREITRVLTPSGRALLWDLRPGRMPLHPALPQPSDRVREAGIPVVRAEPWPWPGPLRLTERLEIRPDPR